MRNELSSTDTLRELSNTLITTSLRDEIDTDPLSTGSTTVVVRVHGSGWK